MFRKAGLSVLIFAAAAFYISARNYDDSLSIHPFINSKEACNECHTKSNLNIIINRPSEACSPQCFTCHKDTKKHHPVNIRIHDKLPDNLSLTRKKRITCITCHKLDSKRYDSRSWKSQSMFETVFKKKDQYKTYYLVKNNSDGQLCKTCH